MKKIVIICFLIIEALLMAEEVTVSYPKNQMGYNFYKNLETGSYQGNYVDILSEINQDNRYNFTYKLAGTKTEDLQLRKRGNFSSRYYYLETPYTQKIFLIGKKNMYLQDLEYLKRVNLGCLDLGVDEVAKLQDTYSFLRDVKTTFFRNETDAYYALQNGKIDLLAVLNFKKSNTFDAEILEILNLKEYIGVKKGNEELLNRIKEDLISLSHDHEKILERNIKNRKEYFQYIYRDLSNYEEIREKYKKLKVWVPSKDFSPYYKERFFKKIGIVPYLMEKIAFFIDAEIEYVFSKDEDWDIQAVDFTQNPKTMSREYFRTKLGGVNHLYDSKITNYTQLNNLKIIKLENMDIDMMLNKIKYKELIEVPTLEDAFKSLKDRKGDVILGPYFLLNQYMLHHNLDKHFKISQSKYDIVVEMTFKDERLRDTLNNFLLSYTTDEMEFISNTSLLLDKPVNIWLILFNIVIALVVIGNVLIVRKYIVKHKLKELVTLFGRIEDINIVKDNRSLYHTTNVSHIAKLIAQELKFSKRKVLNLEKLGLIHDIGLVFIPKEVIIKKKTGILDSKEEKIFREHVNMGDILLKGIGISAKNRKIIKYHHENLDGTGYLKISRRKISIESQILRAGDIYDRVVSWEKKSHEKAMEVLENGRGRYVDARIVDVFYNLEEQLKELYSSENQGKSIETLLKEFEEILSK